MKTDEQINEAMREWNETMTVAQFNGLSKRVHTLAVEKGWWENPRNDGELIALMHAELSEALEGLRHGNPPSDHIPEFNAAEEEFSDVIIRIADMCAARGYRLGEAIVAKHKFNATREHRHGCKKF